MLPSPTRGAFPPNGARKSTVPPGFRAAPKPKPRPIGQMTMRELRDLQERNARTLSSPSASTSTYVQRVSAEQVAIQARLMELGMDTIQDGLQNTTISDDMNVDRSEAPAPQIISAKRRALAKYAAHSNQNAGPSSMSFQEAVEIEQRTLAQDMLRKQRIAERKKRQGLPVKGEMASRQDMDARMWAFLNYKPSESDMEDDDDNDSDEDPSSWFVDDQDDGRKGQDILEPDPEEYAGIIRIDNSRRDFDY